MIIIEPHQQLFSKQTCPVKTGVHKVKGGILLRIIIANFGISPLKLFLGDNVATVKEQNNHLVDSDISHGKLLGIVSGDTHYKKRDININDIYTINLHLVDLREAKHGV